jgi:hypothetical protein
MPAKVCVLSASYETHSFRQDLQDEQDFFLV